MTDRYPEGRVAVAGATGEVAGAVCRLLVAGGCDAVALTRHPDKVRANIGGARAAVDFSRSETLRTALSGCDRLFLAQGSSPEQVENEIALIDAAVAVNIRHIVKLSALGPATRLLPFAWHMQIEAHLARQPVASTVLRPSTFVSVLKFVGPQVAAGTWTGAAGEGKVNLIDPRDVADVAVIALKQNVGPESQRAYHLTGPRPWTMSQVAAELSKQLGYQVEYKHRTPDAQRSALLASGLPPFMTDLLVGLDQLLRESVLAEKTGTVEDLTGQPPRSLTDWLAENIDAFKG